MQIDEERMTEALMFLGASDEKAGELKANVERQEAKVKSMKASVFMMYATAEKTVAERNALAETNPMVGTANEDYFEAVRAFTALQNRRSSETILIEVWRSLHAARKKGNVF